jgi:hypothetical protein
MTSALEVISTSFELRVESSPPPLNYVFLLRADIGENSRLAIWRDQRLIVHPEFAERAEMLVRLGETFDAPVVGSQIPAGFDNPVQAALTLIRAADRILQFDLRLDELALSYDRQSRS